MAMTRLEVVEYNETYQHYKDLISEIGIKRVMEKYQDMQFVDNYTPIARKAVRDAINNHLQHN